MPAVSSLAALVGGKVVGDPHVQIEAVAPLSPSAINGSLLVLAGDR